MRDRRRGSPGLVVLLGKPSGTPGRVFLSKGTFVPLIRRLVPEECWVAVGKEVKAGAGGGLGFGGRTGTPSGQRSMRRRGD